MFGSNEKPGVDLLSKLPITKHFSGDDMSTSTDKLRSGEKNIWNIMKLLVLVGLGYMTWVYILPPVFIALGQFAAAGAVVLAVVATIIAAPSIFKWLKKLAKMMYKAAIRHDPFDELDKQEGILLQRQDTVRKSHGRIKALRKEMIIEADHNEKKAEKLQGKVIRMQSDAQRMKDELATMVTNGGQEAKGTDEYVNLNAESFKLLTDSRRIASQLEQAQDFVRKYGTRGAVMKKISHKLTMVEVNMDAKVLDLRATIDILKQDYEFAAKSKDATSAAKDAMMFDKSWQLEYALDVVTHTIAEDIASTAGNFNDINSMTLNLDMNRDDMYAELDSLANSLEDGSLTTPVAKDYTKEDYKITHEDSMHTGGFEDIY